MAARSRVSPTGPRAPPWRPGGRARTATATDTRREVSSMKIERIHEEGLVKEWHANVI
ncbi:hypothetical protein [Streptomyces sp. HNM0574]|uniref:hypothetical protein n=1 Tax=Streptomyces sp. HNM0574 TaxID=2714954 RepID=UPI00146DC6D0|nr:hypothetical protein [Streptomyces sp. HNM0574]NLU71028.1 hypothetical protein [Streptomyces sp. HNM0574]